MALNQKLNKGSKMTCQEWNYIEYVWQANTKESEEEGGRKTYRWNKLKRYEQ